MAQALSVAVIVDVFPSPILPNHPGKPDYMSIQYTHSLLTVNAELIKSNHREGQNGHLGRILTATQYALVGLLLFFCMTNSSRMSTIPAWAAPFNNKKLIRDHA